MNTRKILLKEIENLSEPMITEVLDYVRFLKYKNQKDLEPYTQSELSLKKEWLLTEEDEAWKNL